MRHPVRVAVALVSLLAACHPAPRVAGGEGGRSVISQEEIETASAANVYDLIKRLHAEWLNDRGKTSILGNEHSQATVFLNAVEYGPLESLRNMPTTRFAAIRYYSGTDAVARFGAQYGGGVIQLVSRVE